MKTAAFIGSFALLGTLCSPLWAEPASLSDLSFKNDSQVRTEQRTQATRIAHARIEHKHHARFHLGDARAQAVDTEIAAFEETQAGPTRYRAVRRDRIPHI